MTDFNIINYAIQILSGYGVLGLWTFILLIDKYQAKKQEKQEQKTLGSIIENNTKIISVNNELVREFKTKLYKGA